MKIGIIGNGFVGSAVHFGFSPQTGCDAEVRVYDKDPMKSLNLLSDTIHESDFIFLSVPTPSNIDGSINIDYVDSALNDISEICKDYNWVDDNVILLRSTVVPGTTRKLQEKYSNLSIVFNPEFLTERSARYDFINQARFIVGGSGKAADRDAKRVSELFKWRFGETVPVILTNYETAELIKYMNNCFFATKVSFLNEMKLIADKCGVDWEMALEGFVRDGRVGHSHMNIPGPDGKFGFGGSCFPKDIQAIIKFGESLGLDMETLNGVWNTNLKVRPERDWEQLKGRSVVDEED
jgi:UDPglucose 6-dehydrogenase|tara:strand:+ start:679 stop:1560 length:882 start_codon:yes stop_codon:yes gene_type:complete